MISKVLCLLLVSCAFAQDYTAEDQTAREQHLAPNYVRQSYNPDIYETARAEPYDFGFQSTDEFGTIMNRQESSDSNGAVRGSYGYTDPYGVFRHVDYVADEYGFRAEVKSNEPGMGTQSPANVQIYAEPPPAGVIVERPYYHPHHQHAQPGSTAQGSSQQPARRNPSAGAANPNRQLRPAPRTQATPTTRVGGARQPNYPYVPQQNPFVSNSLGSNQYPSTVSNQYAQAQGQGQSGTYGQGQGQYGQGQGQYGQGQGQYGQGQGQYGQGQNQYSQGQNPSGAAFQPSGNIYPVRNPYSSQPSSQARSSSGASSASNPQPIVPKPYDGPTYRVGNPHVTDLVRAEKDESGSVLLPTVVATGGSPTLVKHIHTYPAAPAA